MKPIFNLTISLGLLALLIAPPIASRAQRGGRAPTPAECTRWTEGLAAGGQRALEAVTYGAVSLCGDSVVRVLASAIRNAQVERDTAYPSRLAQEAGNVRDPKILHAALDVLADGRRSDRARVMGLLIAVSQNGSFQDMAGMTRLDLFTRAIPSGGICGFNLGYESPGIDNDIPPEAKRRSARVIDAIIYGNGEPALIRNLARCARTTILRSCRKSTSAAYV